MREAEKKISELLGSRRFGLTAQEIANETGVSEKGAERLLESMVLEKKAIKTRAGSNIFFRSALAVVLALLMVSTAYAQDMNSSSFKALPVMASGGGDSGGTTLKISAKIGQLRSGDSISASFDLCSGFICNFLEAVLNDRITFMLEFNISGSGDDAVFADNETALAQYRSNQLSNYYACMHDTSLTDSPVFGIIFAGSSLNYINISSNVTPGSSFLLRVSQDIPGNEFIIPITQTNCTVINTRIPEVSERGSVFNPFVSLDEAINAVELALGYPNIDLVGSFDRSGAFTITIEKNDTDEDQIIVRPG